MTDRALLLVAGRFAGFFVLLAGMILLAGAAGAWRGTQLLTARVTTLLVNALGVPATQSGTSVALSNLTLSIDLACTAIFMVALYSALVLAYPVSGRQRFLGLVLGIPAILLANVIRLVAVAEVSVLPPSLFRFIHDYLFQVGMVLVTVALWAVWLSSARRHAR